VLFKTLEVGGNNKHLVHPTSEVEVCQLQSEQAMATLPRNLVWEGSNKPALSIRRQGIMELWLLNWRNFRIDFQNQRVEKRSNR
jgi:UDP-N-acetylenolpyruvoylglucosamine reductase